MNCSVMNYGPEMSRSFPSGEKVNEADCVLSRLIEREQLRTVALSMNLAGLPSLRVTAPERPVPSPASGPD